MAAAVVCTSAQPCQICKHPCACIYISTRISAEIVSQAPIAKSTGTLANEAASALYLAKQLRAPRLIPHQQSLKIGMPVLWLLMRNRNQGAGLSNGIVIQIRDLNHGLIEATIMNGSNAGDIVFIPCIKVFAKSEVTNYTHGPLIRIQFPIKSAFAP